ncbi:minor capsid protein [Enterococcus sp. AZ103]|uniref:minor capsid protein n=1 Tax=Enterococcus sp. AZ103 TaxID=2774628 RepID=UPI003F271E2F
MLTLADVRDWIKTLNVGQNFYIGKLDNKQEESIGVYQLSTSPPRRTLGGRSMTSYERKTISILIHWNKNAKKTEQVAQLLYSKILSSESVVIAGLSIQYIQLLTNEPVDVGTDDAGVYERVIELDLFYQIKESE